jgi:hypothetical protein
MSLWRYGTSLRRDVCKIVIYRAAIGRTAEPNCPRILTLLSHYL